jgi:hemerythrin
MALIQWTSDLSVNVAEIDKQHQNFIKIINELNDAMLARKGNDVIGTIIDELLDYAKTHFTCEEDYFNQFGYADTHTHRTEHIEFMKKIIQFSNGYRNNKVGLSIEVMHFLSDWLKIHIQISDKKYSALFNEKGLK